MEYSFSIHYGYLIGVLILGAIWLLLFYRRHDLRNEMLWMSIFFSIFGLVERYFVPLYWNPGSLFSLIDHIGVGIESVLYAFFFGGIGGVLYESIISEHHRKIRSKPHLIRFVLPGLLVVLVFGLSYIGLAIHLYSLSLPLLLVAILIGWIRHDLIYESFWGGITFAVLYLLCFLIFVTLLPTYIRETYTLQNLWGIYLFGIPIEEAIFAFAFGATAAPLYEFFKGYRMV